MESVVSIYGATHRITEEKPKIDQDYLLEQTEEQSQTSMMHIIQEEETIMISKDEVSLNTTEVEKGRHNVSGSEP